jgi:hypothetical protein
MNISAPNFEVPGVSLPKEIYVEDMPVVLAAQAIVEDAGELSYSWQFNDNTINGQDEWRLTNDIIRVVGKRYYIKNSTTPVTYSLYNGPLKEAGQNLYERFTTYEIEPGVGIIGEYKAIATNTIGG